ncbi:TP901 family phage tail tape measure protein [Microbacterium resistens]|uniref:TP901 family phage tail tape measure protein n=1 Tax=Microbacterium resistens TaxID=156977 RepID=A0ABU1SD67_9MICO|nr:phage tail tape measure protein [Microbacterium resistens]MDR6867534.1 TP901 family phage tail tape measure protein [Microbacterium resistens]
MSFDAGALQFKIQTVGAQVFKQDQADASAAIEKTGKAAATAAPQVDALGTSTDETAKKSKTAKPPLTEQAKATEEVGEQSRKAKPKQDEQTKATEAQADAAKKLSVALLAAGTAVAAMVTLAVVKSTDFDQAMSNVRAATMSTVAEQEKLADAALDAGADTAYSAREAADAEEELAKAGLSVSDIVGGSLNGALALAAAGQLQVARSAEIMATTLKQYRLPAEQASHVSDLLAAGAGKAQGSVDDLALALQYVGPVAAGLGISLEETTGTLALFASQGQLGERAGTGLRGVLMSLTSPSALAAKTMAEYNVEIFDGGGKMKSLAAISEQLKGAFGGLTEAERSAALGRIFGNEQITAARVLYEGGAEAVEKWTDEVNESGYAARQAAIRQDNLAGDIEKLGGAFDTALIKSGSAANDVLRAMVQGLTEAVDMFGEAPAVVQGTALVLGVAAGAMLLFAGGAVGARVKFLELKAQLDETNMSMTRTAVLGGAAGLALTGIITVVGLLMAAQAEGRAKAQAYADTLDQATLQVTKSTREMAASNLAAKRDWWVFDGRSVIDNARMLGVGVDMVTDAAMGNADQMKALNDELSQYTFGTEEATKKAEELGISQVELGNITDDVRQAVLGEKSAQAESIEVARDKKDATAEGVDASKSAADAYIAEADSVEDLSSKLSKLIDTINKANGVGQDAITSNIDYQDALAKVDEQIQNARDGVDGYAVTLDQSTQAGRDNMGMLVDLAKNAADAAEAQYALDGNTEAYKQRLEDSRQALLDRIDALGIHGEAAGALADQILRIPSETEWKMIAETAEAAWTITDFQKNYGTLSGTIIYRAQLPDLNGDTSGNGRMGTYADGGIVRFNAGGNIYRPENHVAQIARAGDVRIWAEPETGGESYIPHAPSKRARADQIMAETASVLGGTYIPAGATPYASGGFGADGLAAPAVGVTVQSKGGIDLLQYIDVQVHQGQEATAKIIRRS